MDFPEAARSALRIGQGSLEIVDPRQQPGDARDDVVGVDELRYVLLTILIPCRQGEAEVYLVRSVPDTKSAVVASRAAPAIATAGRYESVSKTMWVAISGPASWPIP
jgi:hypothetical protein